MAVSLIVGNWKMYLSYHQSVAWLNSHKDELDILMKDTHHQLVLCPSFDALGASINMLEPLPPSPEAMADRQLTPNSPLILSDLRSKSYRRIRIGAQDCSAHKEGPYTGQVCAQSLKEIGCSYVIIGHSETRKGIKNSTQLTVQKTTLSYENNLIPIVCVGETKDKYLAGTGLKVIEEQLRPLLEIYKKQNERELIIAYEPIWSIGTGIIPDTEYLNSVYSYIIKRCSKMGIQRVPLLLYGGSVDEATILKLRHVSLIQGYLIGKASTDFQKLKKIVKLV